MKPDITSTDFRKKNHSNTEFHENPLSRGRVIPCGRTAIHEKANSRFSQLCERA